MQNINLNKVNNKYIFNQGNDVSTSFETNKKAKQVENGNNKIKKGLIALGILGSAIVAGVAVYKSRGNKALQEASETVNEVKTKLLKEIKFDKGIATLPDGTKYTGLVEDFLNNGDKITLEYVDGVIQKSQRSGYKTLEKVYESKFNADKLVYINENGITRRINLTETARNVQNAQDDFKKIIENDDISLWALKNHDKKYLNKDQKAQLDNLFEKKINAKKAEEIAQNKHKKLKLLFKNHL